MKKQIRPLLIFTLIFLFLTTVAVFLVSGATGTTTYTGDFVTAFPNPERGFHNRYEIINDPTINAYATNNSIAGFTPDMLDRTFARAKANGNTIVHSYLHLDMFQNCDLPQALLDNLSSGLAAVREAGLKIILRPAYEWSGSPAVPESRIIRHMEQLYPVITANADVVMHLEAGWLGPWGEWHDALYCAFSNRSEADTRYRLVKKIMNLTPPYIPICIRYPIFLKELWYMTDNNMVPSDTTALTTAERDRLGFHNDAFLADSADCGTYDNPTWMDNNHYYTTDEKRQWMYDMQTSRGFNTMMGGESMDSSGNNDAAGNNVQSQMALLHTTELNEDYAKVNTDIWKAANLAASGNDPAETAFMRIKRKMGYRLRLIDATFPTSGTAGQNFTISAHLNNDGYAGPVKPRPLYLVFDNGTVRRNIPLANIDVRGWVSGAITLPQQVITLPVDMPAGTYRLALWLPDQNSTLQPRPEYSIRFANQNIWDGVKGYNVLVNAVSIAGGTKTIPAAPANVNATPGNSQVSLSWDASAWAYSYTVLRSITNGSGYTQVATGIIGTSYTNTGLVNGTTYYYVVRAVNDLGTSGNSFQASATPAWDTIAPSVPGGLIASNVTTTSITLTWTASTDDIGVTGYDVFRDGVKITAVTATGYSDSGLTPKTAYAYTVKAKDAAGNISNASSVLAVATLDPDPGLVLDNFDGTPAWPGGNDLGLWAGANGFQNNTGVLQNGALVLEYNNSGWFGSDINRDLSQYKYLVFRIKGAAGGEQTAFKIRIGNVYKFFSELTSTAITTSYQDIRIDMVTNGINRTSPGQLNLEFWFRKSGTVYIDEIRFTKGSDTVDSVAPTTPANLTAASISTSSATLSWTAATDNVGITGYDIFRGTVLIGSTMTTTYTDTGLSLGTSYTYTVKAKDAAGNTSPASAGILVTTPNNASVVTYEAEAPGNTLSGGALVSSSSNCSGGQKVGYIGNGATLQFNNINAGSAGSYRMTIYYLTAVNRSLYYSVNNGTAIKIDGSATGGWDTVGNMTVTVSLNSGNNTIRFLNPSDWAPDVDRITMDTPDTEQPTAPGGLASSNVTPNSIRLIWDASTDNVGVVSYEIYRGTTMIGFTTATSYTDTGLAANTIYSYTVKAKDAAGNLSAASNTLSVKTAAPDTQTPTVPTNLAVTNFTDTTVNLSWTAATDNVGVAYYEIYRDSVKVNTATGVTYTDSGLRPSTTYIYAVKAVDSSANASVLSSKVTVKTKDAVIDPDNDNMTVSAGVPPFRFSPSPDSSLAVHNLTEGAAPVDNPLKGILYWWYKNDNPDLKPTPFSMEWHYFGLGDLMIGPDSYDWEPMEEFLDQVAAHGRQACLRISTNISFGGKDIPAFLQDLPLTDGNLPYDNPRVITAFTNFIKAFGAKYDGDPRIGFITMGLVGKWGEWHTWPYEGGANGNLNLMPSDANCNTIIDAYNAAFKITQLEIRYAKIGGGTHLTTVGRTGYHDDSFCYREADPNLNNQILSMTLPMSMGGKSDSFVQAMLDHGAENKWLTGSIGGEVRPEIQGQFVDPANQTKDDPQMDIEVSHATWMMCNQAGWTVSNTPAMDVLRRFGYNLVVRNAYFNDVASGLMKVGVRIENTGVAPFYYGPDTWPVLIGLKDGSGKVLTSWKTDWNLKKIKPSRIRALPDWNIAGNPQYIDLAEPYYFDTTINASNIAKGTYTLVMRVMNPLERLTKEDLADHNDFSWQPYKEPKKLYFANQEQNLDGWLALGTIQVN